MSIEPVRYHGWNQAYRLANAQVELVVVTEVGPRILHFGFLGATNLLFQAESDLGRSGDEGHRFYGGHRLWHAPESIPRTYQPDNQPAEVEQFDSTLRVTAPAEAGTGIQKQIDLRISEERAQVTLTHRLINRGLWPVELAPWAITQVVPGGEALIPLPGLRQFAAETLQPSFSIAAWPYANLGDPRLRFEEPAIRVRQDSQAGSPLKLGVRGGRGWLAYSLGNAVFVKRAAYQPAARYPDLNSSLEVYTDGSFLELETLGPLQTLQPGDQAEHVEDWFLLTQPEGLDTAQQVGLIESRLA
jgi:hypothetical protein